MKHTDTSILIGRDRGQLAGFSSGLKQEGELRRFIAQTFKKHYQAHIDSYCDQLVGVHDANGSVIAAAGYNLAEDGPLFLEQYLPSPIEKYVEHRFNLNILRSEIAEVGNLAALQAGGARMLIALMTQILHQEGRRWVAFTATKSLINSFHRMGLSPITLAPAKPSKIRNPAVWGSYYLQNPHVAIGDIQLGYHRLGGSQ